MAFVYRLSLVNHHAKLEFIVKHQLYQLGFRQFQINKPQSGYLRRCKLIDFVVFDGSVP